MRHLVRSRWITLFALLVTASLLTGCYQRVVGVKGPGASAYDIYEPNLNEEHEKGILQGIGDFFGALFGAPPADKSKR